MLPANNMGDTAVIDAASRHFLNAVRSLNKHAFKVEGPSRVGLRNLPHNKIPETCGLQPELPIWYPGPTL
jgi:hypothetical protein